MDEKSRCYILQKNGWYFTDDQGYILNRFLMDGVHTPNNIAVSPTGEYVFIACRSEGNVHCWQREIDGINYKRHSDLDMTHIGMGGICIDKNGFLYLSSTPDGYIKVLDPNFKPVDVLSGGRPAIHGPVRAIVSPNGRCLYILQSGGTTPVRMLQWEKLPTNK
jgi:sugar lactone lactonase YvrE